MISTPLRISITGPESAGKSTLAAELAAHYGTVFVPEYARAYLEANGPRYALPDLEAIAHGQLAAEDAAAAQATKLLFCDTDLLVIKIWAENAFGMCPDWVLAELARSRYVLTLLLAPDLSWAPDPLREHPDPAQRWHFYNLYRAELVSRNWPFAEISGPV
jgi:NadR type nicotinamide-nucleotide adenylyltransferase